MSESLPFEPPPSAAQAVLFVDDEPKVLNGLKRMLRPLRHEWMMYFATSGQEALERLATADIDVLVTDMRMPQMNGAELLQHVVDRHPGVIRIALSGDAEPGVVARAVHLAHQYLSKPCDGELLKKKLAQTMRLRHLLNCPTLHAMLAAKTSWRTVPAVYAEVTAELQSPHLSVVRVADIVARHPAITTTVLQLINSAHFGLRGYVSDSARAVQLLGLETVRSLVLSAHVYGQVDTAGVMNHAELWQHSLRTAQGAKTIARRLNLTEREANEAFAAGLLHDVGKLVLAETVADYDAVARLAREAGVSLAASERDAFGASHGEVAAYLFGLWGLSYGIIEAIAWHHAPSQAGNLTRGPLTAVHLANAIDHAHTRGETDVSDVDGSYLAALGLGDAVGGWTTDRREGMGE